MEFEARVRIDQPPQIVWAVLTDVGSWREWWSGRLDGVDPGWVPGAHMLWMFCSPSQIVTCEPSSQLAFADEENGGVEILTLEPADRGSCVVTHAKDLKVTPPSKWRPR